MKEYFFIGERRSKTAQEKGYYWGDEVLCGKVLFDALRYAGIEPTEQVYANLWEDNGEINELTLSLLMGTDAQVVGMGNKVQKELGNREIEHTSIIHPAARGKIRKRGVYQQHIKAVLNE